MNVYNAVLRALTYIISPAVPVVRRMFGHWRIDEFPDHQQWEERHPSMILTANRKEYDWNVAIMTVDLVRRWAYSIYSNDDMVIPTGWVVHRKIGYDSDQPPLMCVMTDGFNIVYVICRGSLTLSDLIASTWDVNATGPPPGPHTIHSGYKYISELCLRELLICLDELSLDNVVISGHSLGAAVGILLAQQLWLRDYHPVVYAYGIPRFSKGDEYPFPINTVICTDDSISLGQYFTDYKHTGTVVFTEGVTHAAHTIDSYYSSLFFGAQRQGTLEVEDIDKYTLVE